MCGIYLIKSHSNYDNFKNIMDPRGPDEQRFSQIDNVTIGINRLSIQDIEGGSQPKENSQYSIVFNGEIFNQKELRSKYNNYRYTTKNSDTETILGCYTQIGKKIFSELIGFFCIIIFDKKSKEIIIARDTIGIKTLYFFHSRDELIFSSEIKFISKLKTLDKNQSSTIEAFVFNTRRTSQTFYDDVREIQKGTITTISIDNKIITRKFSFNAVISGSFEDNLTEAVERWLISDASLAVSLSGGTDSTLIANIIRKKLGHKFNAMTVSFPNANESELALATGKRLGIDVKNIKVDPNEMINDIDGIYEYLDEPYFGDVPSYYIYKKARELGIKVVVTGTGADELFGNYGKCHKGSWKTFLTNNRLANYFPQRISIFEQKKLFNEDFDRFKRFQEYSFSSIKELIYRFDMDNQLVYEFLSMTDKLSSMNSVEARVPFLDQKFIQYIENIDIDIRTKGAPLKSFLLESLSDELTSGIGGTKKVGFTMPIKDLVFSSKKTSIIENLELLKGNKLFNSSRLAEIIHNFETSDPELIWNLNIYSNWLYK